MASYIAGGTATLTSRSSATITIRIGQNARLSRIGFGGTGIFKITSCDIVNSDDVLHASASYPVHSGALGMNQVPVDLADPIVVNSGQDILVGVTDLSAAGNEVGVVVFGVATP